MRIGMYEFVVLFIIVPFLLVRFTGIPRWLLSKARQCNPRLLAAIAAAVLLFFAIFFAACSDSVWTVRVGSLAVAALACLCHYIYTSGDGRGKDDDGTER